MLNGKSQYDKIMSLTGQLSNSNNSFSRRRELAKQLEQQLSNHNVRKQLAFEASQRERTDDFSVAARRCHALSMLWSNALNRCILMTREIIRESKVKMNIDDIRLPGKILQASSKHDDSFDSNGLGILKLSKKSIRNALKFCLENLQNENIPEEGEQVLMEMLAFLCSKKEYMGCFKYAVDYRNAASEIYYRLRKQDDLVSQITFDSTSKAFGNFFYTCTQLGVDIHNFLSDSLEIISEWCKINIQRNTVNSSSRSCQYFFNSIASMLYSHPDHSIGPMKRHGKNLLRYCKRAYVMARASCKEALNRYILAHIFVAQVAGKIQGHIDGDLGDLGSASLTERQLLHLLDLGINDVVRLFEKDETSVIVRRKMPQQNANQVLWCPMDDRQQLQLELVTRLLACAQRLFTAREAWNAMENPEDSLKALMKEPSSKKDDGWMNPELSETLEIPARKLTESPWMSLILRKLMLPKYGTACSSASASIKKSELQHEAEPIKNPLRPVLELITYDSNTVVSPIPYLAIVGACTEFFPAGECWALSAIKNWHCFLPEDKHKGEVIWCHASSAFDLVSLLSILSELLEEHGQPHSDPRTQYWILLILTKLTETTAVVVQNLRDVESNRTNHPSLIMQWRTIWKILIRHDLRYVSFSNLGQNSLGEIFVILLTEIVVRKCTEMHERTVASECKPSSFIYEQQEYIWSFMLLKSSVFRNVRSRAQFDLISSIVKYSGLSDEVVVEEHKSPLRYELLHLVLCSFKELLTSWTQPMSNQLLKNELIRSVVFCIICLVNGNCPCIQWLSSAASRFSIARCDIGYPSFKERSINTMQQDNDNGVYLKLLWDNNRSFDKDPNMPCFKLHRLHFDFPRLVAKRVRDRLKRTERMFEKYTPEFISQNDSGKLRDTVLIFVNDEIPFHSSDAQHTVDSSDRLLVKRESQIVAVKLVLSLLIIPKSLDTALLDQIPDIISFFTISVSDLAILHFEPVEYFEIAYSLCQISQTLIEVIFLHPSRVDLLQQMKASIADCLSIIKRYACHSSNINLSSISNLSSNKESENDNHELNTVEMSLSPQVHLDELNIKNFGEKKRVQSSGHGFHEKIIKRRKTQSVVLSPPNDNCARAIGSLLLIMEPSFSNCRLVCEKLLGTNIDVDPQSIQGDMDLSSVITLANFLSKKEVLLNNSMKQKSTPTVASDELSPITMLCQVIDLVRECAEPSSRCLLFGNYYCAKVAVETLKSGLTLTCEESKQIIDVLSAEDGIHSRPYLRAQRVQAATYLFDNGSDDFHHLFDKFFANSIVKAGFDESDFFSRRLASVAAGAASKKLDGERILNFVKNRVAPIFSASSAQNISDMFADWYRRSGLSSAKEENTSTIEAKDSLEIMESDSIFAKVMLAGTTRNRKTFIQLFYEILEIPVVRPDLQFMSYRALENIACMRGYSDAEELVNLEAESLLSVWLQNCKGANTCTDAGVFPLSLTSPKSIWYIMLYGRYDYLTQTQFSPESNIESLSFRREATMQFVHRHQNFMIPFTLLKSYNIISKCKSSNSLIEFLSNDSGFNIVRLATEASEDDRVDSIRKLLQRHAVDVKTICVLLMHSDDVRKRNIGQSILRLFNQVVSENALLSKMNKNGSLLTKRIIELVGQPRSLDEVMPISENSYYRSIKYLTNSSSKSKNATWDTLIHADTSLTEVTIYAYDKLVKSKLSDHQDYAWSRFDLLGQFLADQLGNSSEQIQLDFFFHILNEIILKSSLKSIKSKALLLIQKLLRESLNSMSQMELDKEVVPVINKLIGVCFHIHEESQCNLLRVLRQNLYKHRLDLRRSCGFHLHAEHRFDLQSNHSACALDLKESIKTTASAHLNHDCLVASFDILLWIIENEKSLRLNYFIFASLSNSFEVNKSDMEFLCKVDKRYSAQTLGKQLGERKNDRKLQHVLKSIYRTQGSHIPYKNKLPVIRNHSIPSHYHTTIDERLLCAELTYLEKIIEETKINEVSDFFLHSLISYLSCICKISHSQKVRYALSRCIALLEPSVMMKISGMCNFNASPSESIDVSLQAELGANCIDCLAELLKAQRTEVAMAAVVTLKTVLASSIGRRSCSLATTATVSLVRPFILKGKSCGVDATVLSEGEINHLKNFVGREVDGRLWCWDKKLWSFGNGTAPRFEVWIRRLTSAIIFCCFNPEEEIYYDGNSAEYTDLSFFWHSQKIAYLDPMFASNIFPLLILALLQREKSKFREENFNGVERLIAKCFEYVLLSWIHPGNSVDMTEKNDLKFKSLSIVIDTLDILRKVSQRFFLSMKHKPNKKTKKKDMKGGHNDGLDPLIPWQGLLYGVTLHVDGIIVVDACMEVQRFASALFFLELFFNSQYGKAGGLFEELDNAVSWMNVIGEFSGSQNISGVNYNLEINNYDGNDLKSRTLRAMSMTGRCYKELGEIELMHATNMQLSSLNFIEDSSNTNFDIDKLRVISPVDTLQVLGSRSHRFGDIGNRSFLSLTDSMEALGLEGLINTYIEGLFVQNKDLKEIVNFQMLREKWFENNLETRNWDAMTGDNSESSRTRRSCVATFSRKVSNQGYFELVSKSLNALTNADKNSSKLFLDQAHSLVIDSVADAVGEELSPVRFINIIDRLRALEDIVTLINAKVNLPKFEFDQIWTLEVSSKIRQITLASLALSYPEKLEFLEDLKDHLWKSCDSALIRGRPQIAESALSKLRYILKLPIRQHFDKIDEILRIRLAEAQIMECRGDFNGAIQRSKQLIRHISDQNSNKFQKCLLCDTQILCGSWMTKYKTQQAREILESYLNPAAARAKRIFDDENTLVNAERAARSFTKLGSTLANLYDDLLLRIHSKEWGETETRLRHQYLQCLNSENYRRELKQEFEKVKKGNPRKEDAFKRWKETENHFLRLEKEYERTNKELCEIKRLVPYYLNFALKSFLTALEMAGTSSDDLSSHMFRMTSLWFSHHSDTAIGDVANNAMEKGLCKIPSFRFVTLINQLFSRIETYDGKNNQKFQSTLQQLVFRMCNDHPYHSILPLLVLTNAKSDLKTGGVQQIIGEINKSGNKYVQDLLHSYRILISAYNDLAHTSTEKYQGSGKKKKIKLSEIYPSAPKKSLDRCLSRLPGIPCVLTCPPAVRPGKDYGDGKEDPIGAERIAGFESDFSITESGIHRPKIVMCAGTQGGSFRQLVKGEDDIRQDAIMSQVFSFVNNLMRKRTNRRVSSEDPIMSRTVVGQTYHKLKMITYTVLPLSPSSGVLEWVEGTLPIIDFLQDKSSLGRIGAHSRYYPGEWNNNQCRLHLEKSPLDEKRKSFDEICARHSPSFRFFFVERFGNSMESWHVAKMNFTRSVAVSSMVGHILGIGDRHLGNILVDQKSGEVVHIDFGFVFEQGLLLPIPECVPFRLTRNIVDGMGPCGTEGLFVHVAEETLLILRQHVQELLAILSAVVADPLYKWNVNPTKAQQCQTEGRKIYHNPEDIQSDPLGKKKSQATAKVINKIKEKLQGYEDSTSGEQQGIEGQVQLLINSARDPNNLCNIFPGWGPWI